MKTYKIELTKEEIDAVVIQIGARIDALREIQKREAREENIERVIKMEGFMQPIISAKEKIENAKYKRL